MYKLLILLDNAFVVYGEYLNLALKICNKLLHGISVIIHVCVFTSDAMQKIANALSANISNTSVNHLNFMNNAIEDRGMFKQH